VDVGGLGLGPFTACGDFPTFTGQENIYTCRQGGTMTGNELLISWEQSREGKQSPGGSRTGARGPAV